MPRALERIVAGWALLGGAAILAVTAVTTLNVGAFVADRVAGAWGADVAGLPGYEDFVRLAVSGAALMFFPWCQARRGHVAVDLFVSALPAAMRRALDRLWLALLVAAAGFLAWFMGMGLLEARDDGVTSSILGWSEWPFYAPGIVSLVLWAAVAAAQIGEPGDGAAERAAEREAGHGT